MSSKEEKLLAAKQKLMVALGDNQTKYLTSMKLWFRKKWSREEFDIESRRLLGPDKVCYHNQFFLALLNKIEVLAQPTTSSASLDSSGSSVSKSGGSGSGKKRKRSSRPTSDRATFDPVDIFDYLPDECPEIVRPPSTPGGSSPPPMMQQRFAVQELFLPDTGLVMGRLLVEAWEQGLVGADDNVPELIVQAVQLQLKNIITTVLLKKKNYRVTCGGTYFYDIGHPLKDPTLRNSLARQQIDDSPVEIDRTISSMAINRAQTTDDTIFLTSCEEIVHRPKRRINLVDLYKALADRQVIAGHTVYSTNMERISQMLN